jgi:hypothetical protein
MTLSRPEPLTTALTWTEVVDVHRCQYEAGNRPKKVLVETDAWPSRMTRFRSRTMTPATSTT